MASKRHLVAAILASIVSVSAASAQGTPVAAEAAPADLRPLLTPRHSEMRLVTLRYTSDRALLAGNYAGNAGGRGGGRGGLAADSNAAQPIVVSPERIARLRHFDASWQGALPKIDAGKLTSDARVELDSLKSTIQRNLSRAPLDSADLTRLLPAIPFTPKLVAILEARLRLEDVYSEAAAGVLTEVTKQIADTRALLAAGLAPGASGTLQASKGDAARAAATVEALRGNLRDWFNFYNTYDPLFTWWMGLPYKHADAALLGYAMLPA